METPKDEVNSLLQSYTIQHILNIFLSFPIYHLNDLYACVSVVICNLLDNCKIKAVLTDVVSFKTDVCEN